MYQRGNQKPQNEERQTIQWLKEMGQKGQTMIYTTLHETH